MLPSAGPPQPPSQPPPSGEAEKETANWLSPSRKTAQETFSPEPPLSDDGDGISVVSSQVETPGSLKVKFSFGKKKKEGEPTDAPGEVQSSQSGLPSTMDEEVFSIPSLSDEDGSEKGDAGPSADVSVPPPSQKRHLPGQGTGVSTPKKPATEEGPALPQEPMLPTGV